MIRLEFDCMASPCEVVLDGPERAGREAVDEVRRIEAKFSRYRPGNVIARINANAGGDAVQVDDETAALLAFAGRLWRDSGGLFDVTSGILRRVWDFRAGRIPSQGELDALLPAIGWPQVEFDGARVRLPRAGMEIDFGGFGKEYAADRAAAVLLGHGVQHALVNLGGDIHVLGPRGDGTPWHVAVEHPRRNGEALATIPLARGAIATSGDYERAFERDGLRYCHILDPRTGWPATHWQSVTVIAANTTTAGALATVAMLKEDEALAWLDAQQARYLAVRADGQVFRGAGPQ